MQVSIYHPGLLETIFSRRKTIEDPDLDGIACESHSFRHAIAGEIAAILNSWRK